MNKRTLNRLFSQDELWYNENIHSNLMSKIHSVLIDRKAERLLNQDEYRVQSTINDFITGHLRNTPFSAVREWHNIDNVVIHNTSSEPMVIYEVKSFIKPHENTVNPKLIFKDILKLSLKKLEYPHIEAYMIIAGKSRVPKQALNSKTLLLPNKFIDGHNRSSITIELSYLEELRVEQRFIELANKHEITRISISPSRWRNYDGMCAISWRINKIL
jgi:hypothetical protein